MGEVKDPKIKLFGMAIELPETSALAAVAAEKVEIGGTAESSDAPGEGSSGQDPSNCMSENVNLSTIAEDQELHEGPHAKEENGVHSSTPEGLKDSKVPPPAVKDAKALPAGHDAGADQTLKSEDNQTENANSHEETLKKPEKILPCPRCNSMDTKFCYFNNYNVKQPRHFCKNCQRHWTAGGTMRNVPVGAGRRKNKNAAASQLPHQTTPETLQSALADFPSDIRPNGTGCNFNSDAPICESMASVLNTADKIMRHDSTSVFHQHGEAVISTSDGSKESEHDHTGGSSMAAANVSGSAGKSGLPELISKCHPLPPLVPYFSDAPWSCPWHSVQWTAPVAPQSFSLATFPFPFYSTGPPPPYWACAVSGAWNIPWPIPPTPTASQSHMSPSSGPNSPTLGKHSRDDNALKSVSQEDEMQKKGNPNKCLWVPKTLRIDDPGEAAKSSIWATLGIKKDRVNSIGGSGLFKAFQTLMKGDDKAHVRETSTVLQANPAALSRSLSFHESS